MNTETILTPASIEAFQKSLTVRSVSSQTMKAYLTDLKMLQQWVSDSGVQVKDFEELAASWLNATRAEMSPATTKRRASSLKAFARHLGNPNLLAEYRSPQTSLPRPSPLSEGRDGIMRMIRHAPTPQVAALVALQGLMGLRVAEARGVTARSFNWHEGSLTVRGKGDKERVIPVPDYIQYILQDACERAGDGPIVSISDRGARAAITRLGRQVGLSRPVSSHDLRATFATEMLRKTGNLRLVQELLGHANSKSTEFYTLVTLDDMRKEMI